MTEQVISLQKILKKSNDLFFGFRKETNLLTEMPDAWFWTPKNFHNNNFIGYLISNQASGTAHRSRISCPAFLYTMQKMLIWDKKMQKIFKCPFEGVSASSSAGLFPDVPVGQINFFKPQRSRRFTENFSPCSSVPLSVLCG